MGEKSLLLNKYKVETYTFSEYRNLVDMENLNKLDKVIAHIKKNKRMYLSNEKDAEEEVLLVPKKM